MLAKIKSVYTKYEISWLTYLLVCLFGIGSWVAVNGLWVELPLFVDRLPEKWNLPSYLIIIMQLANIGPLLYSIGKRLAPSIITEELVILLIVTIGAISCVLLSLFWDRLTFLFGEKHSTAMFVLSFCLAAVDCTSSVVFLTFMANFPPTYMSALFVGETLSGMLPGFVALAQGIGEDKCANNVTRNDTSAYLHEDTNFSPSAFFLVLFAMMVVCGFAFLALNYLPVAKRQHMKVSSREALHRRAVSEEENESLLTPNSDNNGICVSIERHDSSLNRGYTFRLFMYLLVIQAWINCLANGVLPSVQAYACKPYGNKAYHLVVTLTSISSAVTCFVALWLPCRSPIKVTIFAIAYTILSAYMLTVAAMSPLPPLHNSFSGAFIVVSVSVISGSLISYTKLTICTIMRSIGKQALFWCGVAIQTGSFLGAVTMFPLVNVANVFHQAKQEC